MAIMRYSLFKITNRLFAIDIDAVKEVVNLPRITAVPNVELPFAGVFNLRGIIVPLLDFRSILGAEKDSRFSMGTALIVEYQQNVLGLAVEKVLDFITVDKAKIKSSSSPIPAQLNSLLQGVYDYDAIEQVYLIDVKTIFGIIEKMSR
jgi:purine-binding chemotaxis protein CheW